MAQEPDTKDKDFADNISDAVKEVWEHFSHVKNPNDTYRQGLSTLDRMALFVTEKVGTMGFFFLVLGWTFFWLTWNIAAPKSLKFDPPMAFVLWLIISNILQILLMPLLLIGQNLQGRRADIRGEHDYETDKRAEKEIRTILMHFDNQQKLILRILDGLEKQQSAQ